MDLIGCLICHVAERRAGHGRRHALAVEHTDGQRVHVISQIRFQRFVALRHFDGRRSHGIHQIELIRILGHRRSVDRNARNFFVAEQRGQKRNVQHVIGAEVRSEHIDVNDIRLRLGELGDRATVAHILRIGQQRVRRRNLFRDVRFQIGLGKRLHRREESAVAVHLTVLLALHRGQVLIIALRLLDARAVGAVKRLSGYIIVQQRKVRHIVQGHGRVRRDVLRRALGTGETVAVDGSAGQARRALVWDALRGIRLNRISVLIHIPERHGVSVGLPLGVEREVFRRHGRGCIRRCQCRVCVPAHEGIAGFRGRQEVERAAAGHGLLSKLGLAVHVRHRIRQRLQLRIEHQILCGHGSECIRLFQFLVGIPADETIAGLAVFPSSQLRPIGMRFRLPNPRVAVIIRHGVAVAGVVQLQNQTTVTRDRAAQHVQRISLVIGKSQNLHRRYCDHAVGLSAAIVRAPYGVCPIKALCPIFDLISRVAACIPRSSQRVIFRYRYSIVRRNQCFIQIPADKIISRARRRRQGAIGSIECNCFRFRQNRAFSYIKCHGIGIGIPLCVQRKVARDRRIEVVRLRTSRIRVPTREGVTLAHRRFRRLCQQCAILCSLLRDLAAALGIKRDRIRAGRHFRIQGHISGDRAGCIRVRQRHIGIPATKVIPHQAVRLRISLRTIFHCSRFTNGCFPILERQCTGIARPLPCVIVPRAGIMFTSKRGRERVSGRGRCCKNKRPTHGGNFFRCNRQIGIGSFLNRTARCLRKNFSAKRSLNIQLGIAGKVQNSVAAADRVTRTRWTRGKWVFCIDIRAVKHYGIPCVDRQRYIVGVNHSPRHKLIVVCKCIGSMIEIEGHIPINWVNKGRSRQIQARYFQTAGSKCGAAIKAINFPIGIRFVCFDHITVCRAEPKQPVCIIDLRESSILIATTCVHFDRPAIGTAIVDSYHCLNIVAL